mmetsp:Transcript_6074/g.8576  ORF Transcript_6074/g.8576 Transcript_6074/m.8576 type:complete len:103 (+) Transcript_6074:590-898(+)
MTPSSKGLRLRRPDRSLRFLGEPLREYEEASWASLPMNEGDLILLHGALLHRSAANRSQRTRLAYTFHIVERKACLWSPQNWLQRSPEVPFPSIFELMDGTG